jgi:phage FluMu protein Com
MGETLSNRPLFSLRKMKASAAVLTREKQRTAHLENNLPRSNTTNQIKEEKHEQETQDVKSDFPLKPTRLHRIHGGHCPPSLI